MAASWAGERMTGNDVPAASENARVISSLLRGRLRVLTVGSTGTVVVSAWSQLAKPRWIGRGTRIGKKVPSASVRRSWQADGGAHVSWRIGRGAVAAKRSVSAGP